MLLFVCQACVSQTNRNEGHQCASLRTSVVADVLTGVGSASVAMVASRYIYIYI